MFGKKYVIYVTPKNADSGYLSHGTNGQECVAPTPVLARQFNSQVIAGLKALLLEMRTPGTTARPIPDPRVASLDTNCRSLGLHEESAGSALGGRRPSGLTVSF